MLSLYSVAFVFMISGLTSWNWVTNWKTLPGEDHLLPFLPLLVPYSSLSRIWDPVAFSSFHIDMSIGVVLIQVLSRQPYH